MTFERFSPDAEVTGTDVPVYAGEGPDRRLVGHGTVGTDSVGITLELRFDDPTASAAARAALAAANASHVSLVQEVNDRLQEVMAELSTAAFNLGPRLAPEHHAAIARALAEYSPDDPGHVRLAAALLECPDCAGTGLRQDDAFWIAVDAVADELMSIYELRKLPKCGRCSGDGFIS